MTVTTLADRWRDAFAALERGCPWPGPRPLSEDDLDRFGAAEQLLIGRDSDRRDFLREVDSEHRLIFLTGASGVGKTSLLQVGLVPVLRESGYRVAVCRDWTRDDREATPAEFLASKVRAQLIESMPDLAEGPELFWDLDARGRIVIVLDQFEELLRWDKAMQRGLFALIVDLNHATRIKLVVSFRAEFLHEMRPLENRARAFSMSHFALEPVDAAFALDLVTAPNRIAEAVTPGAAATIAAYWREAVERPATSDARTGIGLLHLQALLYALHASAPNGVITQDQLDDYPDDPVQLFVDGLVRAAEVKLDRCRRASHFDEDADLYLIEGTTHVLARSVRHLSSAGYKLVRELVELAEVTMGDQLTTLVDAAEDAGGDVTTPQVRALFSVLSDVAFGDQMQVADLLRLDREEVARRADELVAGPVVSPWAKRLEVDSLRADPTGASSGAMLDMPPAAVLIEEVRRFVFALVWLSESTVVRISRPGNDTMVSLVHDGFGNALAAWSRAVLDRPAGILYALTAPRGALLRWDGGSPNVLPNLRWRGNTVSAPFEGVTFVNCDFRGTLFLECVFDGTSFVNCLLDGAMFSDCAIRGVLPEATGAWATEEPSFVVRAPESVLTALARYRGGDPAVGWLSSPAHGLPAVPVRDVAHQGEFLGEATPAPGGLTFVGGRVSSFMMRRCVIDPDSAVSFRHVAGSGIDVVEQPAGRYEFFGSALRHVTFSTTREAPEADQIDVRARRSMLAQAWFGDPIRGTFRAEDCKLIQVWNGSASVVAEAAASAATGCVGVDDVGGCVGIGDAPPFLPMDRIDVDHGVRTSTRRMDYRVS